MSKVQSDPLSVVETACGTLLYELQIIWDEVGECEAERDKMLLEIEEECLEVYRRRVDHANQCRSELRQAIADSEAELAAICSSMGERPVHPRKSDQNPGSLKEDLRAVLPQLEEMRKMKCERRNQFIEVLEQIQRISHEIHRSPEHAPSITIVDETDLSLRKLEEMHRELQALQKEKSDRLNHVFNLLNILNSLCLVLGVDYNETVNEVHPSFCNNSEGTMNISNDTMKKLETAIQRLREVKIRRMRRLQDLARSILELWHLMDTPVEEQQILQNVTCKIAASEHEITEPDMLSADLIESVEAEVSRMEELKVSKIKELVLKKRLELEEICRKTHLIPESENEMRIAIEAIESGVVDSAFVLEQIELQIAKVNEEAFSRKEILERVEKWFAACEEECWLEEYNMDLNRYNAGRGAHLTLKRAEKARALVNKLPGMVEALASKTTSWERQMGIEFHYDGVRLLSMLEEYSILRQEKEQERKRQRDQKKLQEQLMAEQEALFGSKPSPMKLQSAKKRPVSCGGASNRRLSLGGTMLQTPKVDPLQSIKTTPNTRQARKNDRLHLNDQLPLARDDAFAAISAGRRGSDIAGLPLRKHSVNAVIANEVEAPMKRKPLLPICSTEQSKFNIANLTEDLSRNQNEKPQSNATQFTTPSKIISAGEEENRTPEVAIPMPNTPLTVSVPMQTAMTPAPPPVAPYRGNLAEELEYSFEERRFGCVLPSRTHLKTVIQV